MEAEYIYILYTHTKKAHAKLLEMQWADPSFQRILKCKYTMEEQSHITWLTTASSCLEVCVRMYTEEEERI